MKTTILLITSLFFTALTSFGQKGQTIAVPGVHTSGLQTSQDAVTKLLALELVKINKYRVYDEFDLKQGVVNDPEFQECYGKSCLIKMGEALEVDYILSGSVDGIGHKIAVNLKLIDVKNGRLQTTILKEFDMVEIELQRMLGVALREMHKVEQDEVAKKMLAYKDDIIVSTRVGRINNSGPRIGAAYVTHGELYDFYTNRTTNQGGLGMLPIMTNLGYQFEFQYIGTDNFSGLLEFIPNVSGMEQGQFIPSLSIMNGFRFGKAGWEFAFGPTIGVRKVIDGFIDSDNKYWTKDEYEAADYSQWKQDSLNWDPVAEIELQQYNSPNQDYRTFLDNRGEYKLRASWIMGIGRTFRAGALNIPFNVYYSSDRFGGIVGFSLGFNITKKKYSL